VNEYDHDDKSQVKENCNSNYQGDVVIPHELYFIDINNNDDNNENNNNIIFELEKEEKKRDDCNNIKKENRIPINNYHQEEQSEIIAKSFMKRIHFGLPIEQKNNFKKAKTNIVKNHNHVITKENKENILAISKKDNTKLKEDENENKHRYWFDSVVIKADNNNNIYSTIEEIPV